MSSPNAKHTHTHILMYIPPLHSLSECLVASCDRYETCDSEAAAPVTYCTELQRVPAAMLEKSCFHLQYASKLWVTMKRKCKRAHHHHLHHHQCRGGRAAGKVGQNVNPLLSVGHVCIYIFFYIAYILSLFSACVGSCDQMYDCSHVPGSEVTPASELLCIAVSPWQQVFSTTKNSDTSE